MPTRSPGRGGAGRADYRLQVGGSSAAAVSPGEAMLSPGQRARAARQASLGRTLRKFVTLLMAAAEALTEN